MYFDIQLNKNSKKKKKEKKVLDPIGRFIDNGRFVRNS